MGGLVNYWLTTVLASVVAGLIIVLNIFLLYQTFSGAIMFINLLTWSAEKPARADKAAVGAINRPQRLAG